MFCGVSGGSKLAPQSSVGGLKGHLGSKLGDLGIFLAPKLGILGQLGHLMRQLGHSRKHLAPKVGNKTPSSGSAPDRPSLRTEDLDPWGGVGGGVFGNWQFESGKLQLAVGNWQ